MSFLSSCQTDRVLDTHIHLYDPTRPAGVDWPNPEMPRVYRPMLPETFREVAERNDVDAVVVVEASDRVEDNQWLLDLTAPHADLYPGIVGNLPAGTPEFAPNLERLCEDPRYRGVRIRNLPKGGVTPALLDDLRLLAGKGRTLDLLIRFITLEEAEAIARGVPELKIILDHCAGARHEGDPVDAEWVAAVNRIAALPNVHCKLSGLFEYSWEIPAPEEEAHYLPTLQVVWDAFGEDRLIYGSNWPVTRHFERSYEDLRRIVGSFLADKGDAAAAKVLWKNGAMFYGVEL